MKGEFSRLSFDPRKRYAGVLQQQGRVGLDADWNEWVEIVLGKIGSLTRDTIGESGRPQQAAGFEISIDSAVLPPDLLISDGRLYAGGLLAESESPGHKGKHFSAQADWPLPSKADWNVLFAQEMPWPGLDFSSIAAGGSMTQLIYAEVWLRHVTALNDEAARDEAVADTAGNPDWTARPVLGDSIRERALGGPDTCTRLQTVSQVKHWDNLTTDIQTCDQACAALATALPPKTIGTMLLGVTPTPPVTDPCQEPLQGGYGGAWNRSYRVEIHDPGAAGTASFKWSNENGAFTVRIRGTALSGVAAATDIVVISIGADQETQLSANDWVEVCGEETELGMFRNALAQVKATPITNADGTWTIQLTGPVVIPHAPFLRRWSAGTHVIQLNQQFNLDAGSGLAVTFFDASGGAAGPTDFHSQDYWIWSARGDTRTVEPEALSHVAQPPRGIERHYCCLAILTWENQNGSIVNTANAQCTPVFPPLTGITAEGCDCTVCVSAKSHNNNVLTIQAAIDQVEGNGGGKVCLGPGTYNITSTITVNGKAAIDISGHGLPSLVAAVSATQQPILVIDSTMNINVEGVGFFGPPDDPDQTPIPGIVISNSSFVTIQRCLFTSSPASPAPSVAVRPAAIGGPGPGGTLSPAIGVNGFALNIQIHDNSFSNVQIGIGLSPIGQPTTPQLQLWSIRNNALGCTEAGMAINDAFVVEMSFADNSVSSPSGFLFNGSGSYVSIERNTFAITGNGITSNASQSRIKDNTILPSQPSSGNDGIFLQSSSPIQNVEVSGNQISGLLGPGIVVGTGTVLNRVAISRNRLSNLGGAGILAFGATLTTDLDIIGNVMTTVGQERQVALTGSPEIGILGGILLLGSGHSNLRICENVIESVGPPLDEPPPAGTWILGVYASVASNLRIAGNRIVDVAPLGPIARGNGILLSSVTGRTDVSDNEVRRTATTGSGTDQSPWTALELFSDHASVRGNLFYSFGTTPTVIIEATQSCLFSDNQCFLDNGFVNVAALVLIANISGATIIASNNYLLGEGFAEMNLNPTGKPLQLGVVGNILNGQITVGPGNLSGSLPAPWAALNAML